MIILIYDFLKTTLECTSAFECIINKFLCFSNTFFQRIPLNVRDIVYCTGVSLMDEDVWEFIWMKFHSTTAVSEKKILLEALTCSDDRTLLNRYANLVDSLLAAKEYPPNSCSLFLCKI